MPSDMNDGMSYQPFLASTPVHETELNDPTSSYGVEELAYMVTNERVKILQNRMEANLKELKQRLANVRALTDYMALLNSLTDANGQIDLLKDPDYKQRLDKIIAQLEEAPLTFPNEDPKELPEGGRKLCFDIPKDNNGQYQTLFSTEERERLLEAVQNKTKNLTFDNHMQMQETARLASEKTDIYQCLKMAIDPIHRAKITCARAIATHRS